MFDVAPQQRTRKSVYEQWVASQGVPLVQGGRVRGFAVTSDARNPQVPDLPTMVESGLPDFVTVSFTGVDGEVTAPLFAPA